MSIVRSLVLVYVYFMTHSKVFMIKTLDNVPSPPAASKAQVRLRESVKTLVWLTYKPYCSSEVQVGGAGAPPREISHLSFV